MFGNFYYSVHDIIITFVYLKLSFVFDVMNISFILYIVVIALYMASSSHKRHRTRKGKAPTKDHVVPPPPVMGIEEVLVIQDTLVQNVK